MAIITAVFGVLLVAVGGYGFGPKANLHDFAIYPVVFGVLLLLCGLAGIKRNPKFAPILGYIQGGIAVLGLLLSALMALNGYGSARSEGVDVDTMLLYYRLAMTVVLLFYMNLWLRTFLNERAQRKALAEQD